MKEFFAMGGYAVYVWSSYALTLLVFVALFIQPILRRKHLLNQLARKQRRAEQLAARKLKEVEHIEGS